MSLNPLSIKLSWIEVLRGFITTTIAYLALRCLSLARICKILSLIKSHCHCEVDLNEANIAWAAVRKSSFFFLGRAACLELSLAFMLFFLTKGISATWCVGVAIEPFRSHAWIEINGKPFREANYLEQHFNKLFVV